jgi:crossover junction endodeoxyribonuclease RuvC
MVALGIDPGSRVAGYGVVEVVAQGRFRSIAAGALVLRGETLSDRLLELHLAIAKLLAEHRPQSAAVEGVFSHRGARSALVLGHARGVALLAIAQAEVPVYEYPPATVKRSLTHGGASSKAAVARAVRQLLALTQPLRADATDALAVAICHLARLHGPGASAGRPSPWLRAVASAPAQPPTPQNLLLQAAWRHR